MLKILKISGLMAAIVVSAFALYESVLGLMQLFGLSVSGHARFAMTGSFDNPGPYGGVIAFLLAILVSFIVLNRTDSTLVSRVVKVLAVCASAMCVIVLPATFSRSAWLALAVAMFALGFRELGLKSWIVSHKRTSIILAVFILLSGAGIFCFKLDSAIGRLHIWHMELRAIADKPWIGHGAGRVLGVYGAEQAEYFAEKERSEVLVRIAGCPEYAFNEYLRIGVEFGIPVMVAVTVLLLLVIFLFMHCRSPFAYGLIVFAVFAFFSYPLNIFRVESDAEKEWNDLRYLNSMELFEESAVSLAPLYEDLKYNYRYLYDYGYALHKSGKFTESNVILMEGASVSSDPMFYNIIGKNHEAMGEYEKARDCYIHAHNMVPCRIYPLSLLMKMYIRIGQYADAAECGKQIMLMPVNERHETMIRLHREVAVTLDSLMIGLK